MNTIIVTGGMKPPMERLKPYLKEAHKIIAADSGLEYCHSNGITPDYIVGDFDSLEEKVLLDIYNHIPIERHSTVKDDTDTELALQIANKMSSGRRIIVGGGEGRLDHSLAILNLFKGNNPPDLWLTAKERIFSVNDFYKGSGCKGDLISFYSLSGIVDIKGCSGLQWGLEEVRWNAGQMSLSNRLTEREYSVEINTGCLLVLHSFYTS